ncbi:hypothetical protein [Xanthomonas hortorum]|uniref:Uncharacterized protein n=1 Tax=Xanthomonas hortorum pv. pelargonii TaxID=453602 RepID=A0A6V7CNC3_9XANT|nr:hypothetical protein [Xanthomonas hortorum]MCE4356390.1 hypothetical protein [Xanthomonas hortorum pv. pelargonii]MCM5525789.1 hypothetical protein [Xanthomonas hortorum pv. pelargonii]MCM5538145.1 hypothetical protein [Xanthomonas hortorum pv. pelargonii]MCM5542340.1 hypothetical protein [Xanthomonas hortorum pv. pelargonii]MCM5545943.1 hypothetical protein [Xanthomonas hortorum pv. pelargonii]
MEEPNKSALVLLLQEATELLQLFDRLRGDALPVEANSPQIAVAPTMATEQTGHVAI